MLSPPSHLADHFQQLVHCMAMSLGFEFAVIGIQTADRKSIGTLAIDSKGKPVELTYPVKNTPCKITLEGEPYIVPADAARLYPDDEPLVQLGTESYAGARFHDAVTGRYGVVAGLSTKPIHDVDRMTTLIATFASSAETARRAEAATQSRDRFIASISHEIRTPMTAIIGHAELLADPQTAAANHDEHIQTITNSGKQLLNLINDFLDTAKLDAGSLKVECAPVRPAQIAADVVALHSPKARGKGIELICTHAPSVPECATTDQYRISQILGNLIDNAIKFTEQGTVSLHVDFETDPAALLFRISDTGTGIPDHLQKTIFDPFAQVNQDQPNAPKGTGLGLTICAKLAKLLGGSIELDSTIGMGSTFTLRIDPGCTCSTPEIDAPPTPIPADALRGRSILLVDDSETIRRLLYMFLTRAGAKVTTAKDGQHALDTINASAPFDLIIMDIQMPIMDGPTATRAIREMGIASPILALTANTAHSDKEECHRAGCSAFLTKPVPRNTFIETCAQLTQTVTV